MTSRSAMVARFINSSGDVDKIKVVTGHEMMLFVGWPRERLAELLPMEGPMLRQFAGAAFSGFAVLPILTVSLYGAGKCGLTGDPAQELEEPRPTKPAECKSADFDSDDAADEKGSESSSSD